MSIEGLWTVRFGAVAGEAVLNESAGVVVLRAGRVLGGDTWTYFDGWYSEAGSVVQFNLDVRVHFATGGESIFGGPLQPFSLRGDVRKGQDPNRLSGKLDVVGVEGAVLVAVLQRVVTWPEEPRA